MTSFRGFGELLAYTLLKLVRSSCINLIAQQILFDHPLSCPSTVALFNKFVVLYECISDDCIVSTLKCLRNTIVGTQELVLS